MEPNGQTSPKPVTISDSADNIDLAAAPYTNFLSSISEKPRNGTCLRLTGGGNTIAQAVADSGRNSDCAGYRATWNIPLLMMRDSMSYFGWSKRLWEVAQNLGAHPDDALSFSLSGGKNIYNRDGSLLASFVERGQADVVKQLLEAGANPNLQTFHGSALDIALSKNHHQLVEMLLLHGARFDYGACAPKASRVGVSHMAEQTLLESVNNGDLKMMQLLLAGGVSPNEVERRGPSAERFADLKERLEWIGVTPLHAASVSGNLEAVQLLLCYGADPNQLSFDMGLRDYVFGIGKRPKDVQGNRKHAPLHSAIETRQKDMVGLLLDHGANPNLGSDGFTPLYLASQWGYEQIANLLIAGGAELNSGPDDTTPLHIAVYKGHTGVVKDLLEAGADIKRAEKFGVSLIELARQQGHQAVAGLLEPYYA